MVHCLCQGTVHINSNSNKSHFCHLQFLLSSLQDRHLFLRLVYSQKLVSRGQKSLLRKKGNLEGGVGRRGQGKEGKGDRLSQPKRAPS